MAIICHKWLIIAIKFIYEFLSRIINERDDIKWQAIQDLNL